MKLRRSVATAMACLSLAGCHMAAKRPISEDRADIKLVERYNTDVGKRLRRHLEELMQVKSEIQKFKERRADYVELKKNYTKAKKLKCEEREEITLTGLHAEVVDWRSSMAEGLGQLSAKIKKLIARLEEEERDMKKTDTEVGRSVMAPENKGMVKTLLALSLDMEDELALLEMEPVPKAECPDKIEVAGDPFADKEKNGHQANAVDKDGRQFTTGLEPGLKKPEVEEEDIYAEGDASAEKPSEFRPSHP